MWGWGRGGEKEIRERITALEKATEGLVTGAKGIRLEWEDVYDKLNRTMSRLNARIRRQDAQEAPGEELAGPLDVAQPVGTHHLLKAARERRG